MIHIVLGTKAQLIKMAPIMKILTLKGIGYNYISTGQHKETIDDILSNFNIKKPDFQLYSGKDITSVFSMLFWSLQILIKSFFQKNKVFKNDRKGIVLVHGDTLSTVLGALMGKFSGLKVGHVESGLRSFNLFQPFPEEIFRIITFKIADIMFCPGDWAVENLKKFKGTKINTLSNTLYDSLIIAKPEIEKIRDIRLPAQKFAIVTLHRFENLKNIEILSKIVDLIIKVSEKINLIFIMHKLTEKKLIKYGLLDKLASVKRIELRQRYDYFRFIKLITCSEFVISDGGSNQEECSYLGKPVLLFRNVTERNEGLGSNAVISKFDEKIIFDFLDNYSNIQGGFKIIDNSPSELIVDYCIDIMK
ncbi:MAG: UDP-N-acetylglucosamine 2-epimerase [Candidatus Delongbacteria bacterium]|nr:UDP-N-acetylglucosamine 2-epimerase [Candidatus Delongbacteria bacterium]MCG2760857.1 UDP-N-acetylglucosamine 2-epimerase [Candidatus Delongbacteria bacterium]